MDNYLDLKIRTSSAGLFNPFHLLYNEILARRLSLDSLFQIWGKIMKRLSTALVMVSVLCITVTYNACSKGGFSLGGLSTDLASSGTAGSDLASGGGIDGKVLYSTNCASCHSALIRSAKQDRTFEQISNALSTIPSMSAIKLTSQEIQAISLALKSPGADGAACTVSSAGNSVVRRLTRNELQNALVDLLGVNFNFVAGVDVDTPGTSGFSNDGKSLSIGYLQLAKVITAVESAVTTTLATANTPFLKCTNNAQDATCAKAQLQSFARKAYRRTPSTADINALMAVYTANQSAGFSQALGLAMEAVLLSPDFMYVTAFSGTASAKGTALSQQEFAMRLSLFLWNSVPDTALLDLADQGTLQQPAILKAQVARMLADAKAQRFIDNMFKEWLKYDKVADDTVIIRTGITPQMRTDMVGETSAFLRSLFAEDKSLITLVSADYGYLNANMANHYGIAGVSGTSFQKVSLANSGRRGVLSQASLLTVLSNVDDSRPVGRGHFLMEKVLCSPPPPPPPDVNTGALTGVDTSTLTVRELMALHASKPSCAGCHSTMDPLGLSLENFNQLGQYRNIYKNGKTVDASGTLAQKSFNNFAEMDVILTQQSKVRSCLAAQVLTYALNRAPSADENCMAAKLAAVAVTDTSKMSDLIFQIVSSDMFNYNITDSK